MTCKQKTASRVRLSRARAQAQGRRNGPTRARTWAHAVPIRDVPQHEPRKRSYEPHDNSFVMMDGWQIKHRPSFINKAHHLLEAAEGRMARAIKLSTHKHITDARKAKLERRVEQCVERVAVIRNAIDQLRLEAEAAADKGEV